MKEFDYVAYTADYGLNKLCVEKMAKVKLKENTQRGKASVEKFEDQPSKTRKQNHSLSKAPN